MCESTRLYACVHTCAKARLDALCVLAARNLYMQKGRLKWIVNFECFKPNIKHNRQQMRGVKIEILINMPLSVGAKA